MQDSSTCPPIKVDYASLPRLPLTKWPLVEISLSTRDKSLPQSLFALVDSGANISIFHFEVAEFFGYTARNLQFKTRGKSVSGDYKSAIIEKNFSVELYGYNFLQKFTVVDNPHLLFPCILGEDSLFQWARLDFQKFKGFFEIKFRKDLH